MKNTKRIFMLILAVALLVACIATVTVSAAPPSKIYAGAGMTPTEYMNEYATSVVFRNDNIEAQFNSPSWIGSAGSTYLEGEKSSDARTGAKSVYDENDGQKGFMIFTYGNMETDPEKLKKWDTPPARHYETFVWSSLSTVVNPKNGYIIEFDVAVLSFIDDKGDEDPANDERKWEFPGYVNKSGNFAGEKVWLEFLTGGSAKDTNDKGQQLYSGTFMTFERVPGEEAFYITAGLNSGMYGKVKIQADDWAHVTWVYDAYNLVFSIYVGDDVDGRQLVGYLPVVEGLYPVNVRVGGQCTHGQLAFDNFLAYSGTKVHDPLYIERMTDEEKLVYFVDILADDSLSSSDRYSALNQIRSLIDNFPDLSTSTNLDVVNSLKIYNKLIADESFVGLIEGDAMYSNALKYAKLVDEAAALPRSLANISTRSAKISNVDSFYNSLKGFIDSECSEYKAAQKTIVALKAELDQDNAAVVFINSMSKFAACEELGFSMSMRRHYETAGESLTNCVPPSNYIDDGPNDLNSLYKRYVKAWSDYESAGVILDSVEMRINASRFVELVLILNERKSEWFTDDGTCKRLWLNARNILAGGHYNSEDIAGFESAYADFTISGGIDEQFWNYIQQEHIAVLEERLGQFNAPGVTYIERFSIITYVDYYMDTNKDMIDPGNTKVAELVTIAENYKKNLASYEEDYLKQLKENSQKFVNLVSIMKEMSTYAEITPLFEEATVCYYGMDIPDEETMTAVVYYEELAARRAVIEENCDVFAEIVAALPEVEGKDALYTALVEGYACLEYIDTTVSGVGENLAVYQAAYDSYMAPVDIANSEISSATDVVTSVRAYCGIDELVDYANTIIE